MPKKKKVSEINFPDDISKMAQSSKTLRLKKEIQKEFSRKIKREEVARLKTKRVKEGLVFAKKVFAWAESFRESEAGQELMRANYSEIFFFDGQIEGIRWVGLLVSPKGLSLSNGGRWSVIFRKVIDSPEDLAASTDTRVLKEACAWIEDGRVWDCIKRRFLYLNERERRRSLYLSEKK